MLRGAARRRHVDRLHLPQARRGARDRRPRDGAAARQAHRHGRRPRARPRRSLARIMVGRDVLLRVDKAPLEPPRADARGPRPARRATTAACRPCRASTSTVRARRDRRAGGRRRQRPAASSSRRSPACGPSSRARSSSRARTVTGARRARRVDAGVAHIAEDRHRRGLVLDFTLAENLALREYRTPKMSRRGWLSPRRMVERARARCSRSSTSAAASPRRSPRRCRAATSRRSSSPARSPATRRCCRRPADARARRRRDRVRPPPPASPSATRAAAILLVSLEFEEVRSLADRILVIYEGRIVGELPPDATEEELGHR